MNEKQLGWLFQGLQELVNLGDGPADFQKFAQSWPRFFPVRLCNLHDSHQTLDWDPRCHPFVLAFRDMLRSLWRMGSERTLGMLLGVHHESWNLINKRQKPGTLAQILGAPETRLYEAMQEIPPEYFADLPDVHPDWRAGEFRYERKNDFQEAVYRLWRQSWRAKVCRSCSKCFIADRPAQMYCSVDCSVAKKRERGLDWWRREGNKWRKAKARSPAPQTRKPKRTQVKAKRASKETQR